MEILVMIIMLLVGFTFLLKLTFHNAVGIAMTTVVIALFAGLSWEWASGMSKTQITDWLSRPDLMLDTAVLLAIDVMCQIAFCILAVSHEGGERLSRTLSAIYKLLLWVPGILIFPVLLSILTTLVFSLTGVDFQFIGWGLALALTVVTPILALGLKWLFPDVDSRLELMFFISLLILALGIVTTVNGRTAAVGTNEVHPDALAAIIALVLLGSLAGIIINRYNIRKRISKLS